MYGTAASNFPSSVAKPKNVYYVATQLHMEALRLRANFKWTEGKRTQMSGLKQSSTVPFNQNITETFFTAALFVPACSVPDIGKIGDSEAE